jgi:hypothetical protein
LRVFRDYFNLHHWLLVLNYVVTSKFPLNQSTGLAVFSLLAAVILILLWATGRKQDRRWHYNLDWVLFATLAAFSLAYPLQILIYQSATHSTAPEDVIHVCGATLVGILSFIGQIYFYSRYIYGNSSSLDTIGMGIPVKVKLAGTEENITLLAHMGLPIQPPDMTAEVLLIDETDSHYILGNGTGAAMKVYKIDKALIKGIVYI